MLTHLYMQGFFCIQTSMAALMVHFYFLKKKPHLFLQVGHTTYWLRI